MTVALGQLASSKLWCTLRPRGADSWRAFWPRTLCDPVSEDQSPGLPRKIWVMGNLQRSTTKPSRRWSRVRICSKYRHPLGRARIFGM